MFVLYPLLYVTYSSWNATLFPTAVFLAIFSTFLTILLPSCVLFTPPSINFLIGILHWILRIFSLSYVLEVCVRAGGGGTLWKWFCLLFHFLPNLYIHSFSCQLFLFTFSLSSSFSTPAQCHTRRHVATSDPMLHFFCPKRLVHKHAAVAVSRLYAVLTSNLDAACRSTNCATDVRCRLQLTFCVI